MAVLNEIPKIEEWIYSKLSASSAVTARVEARIHPYQAPENEPHPFVLFNYQSPYNGGDQRGLGTVRILTSTIWQIKLIASGAPLAEDLAVVNAFDQLFQSAAAQTLNGYVFSSRRIEPVSYLEQVPRGAETIRHLGGLYLIQVYPS